ncbi:MAG: 1-deoxy-D-xylulose-5-phosphate synthase [Spirochaetales bacterium]|nr:1-deoxy-D-xylulose-5-phosphate synthase [Spirochaetales bacterium]
MNHSILSGIRSPQDLRSLSNIELKNLSNELRKQIIEVVGTNGGHLSSNLGVVELTIALHRVFESPQDQFVWDVGHQCYTHKMLTGRFERFSTIRKKDGLSGFPKREESPHDSFDTGHSSTSISAAYGLLTAKKLRGEPGKVVAVIGDGALTGGMALEALSHAGQGQNDLVVILNDNKMSISPNTGALSEYLSRLTMGASYQRFRYRVDRAVRSIPLIGVFLAKIVHRMKRGLKGLVFKDNLFVDLGFEYVGPLNGHNIEELEKVLRDVRALKRPVVVHVLTRKGKGYSLAENDPSTFHGIGPFCISDGKVEKFDTTSFTEAFSRSLLEEASRDPRIVAITAAMAKGTGLAAFQHRYPDRFFDVGIAEQHAVTFAGGLAAGGMRPVVAIYSTFMQRAVDQLVHDAALQKLPVVFALDRSGAVPDDGETHQGLFDIALFRPVPGVSILAPASAREMSLMLSWALGRDEPVIIRYPKAACPTEQSAFDLPLETGKGVFTQRDGADILIACTGGIYAEVHEAANMLARSSLPVDTYNLRFIKPLDEDFLVSCASGYRAVLFVEDGSETGGITSDLASIVRERLPHVLAASMAFPDIFYPQGTRQEILSFAGLSAVHIYDEALKLRSYIAAGQSR